ncbi:MAG: DNA polymerase IV [Deltaproteobacteria bacterium]|nr:DNA polymerase IV [Deltaproteobacteria bacterium]
MILHIDMDAFYASVEQLDNAGLRGKCVIVGGTSNRGVVSAASYEARKYGVHSAMPVFQARRRCPQGIFIPPRMARYKEVSTKIMSILRQYTPLVEPVSIDEAYMDIAGCEKLYGGAEATAVDIKRKIRESVHLTCSIGVAPIKFLAKIASGMNKPDGLTVIAPEVMQRFIDDLAIGKVPGVGEMTHKKLDAMGIKTLGDVKRFPPEVLIKRLGKFGTRLVNLSAGIDTSPVIPTSEHKSVSSEQTLEKDTRDKALLNEYLLKHAEDVARQIRKSGMKAKTITIKVKHSDFKQATRSITIASPTQSSKIIYQKAKQLLEAYPIKKKVRLIGVGVSGLVSKDSPVQLSLFEMNEPDHNKWEKVDRAVDSIQNKFGKTAVSRASLKEPQQKYEFSRSPLRGL